MDAETFLLNGNANDLLAVLRKATCRDCDGTGERNDAESGDISFKSWVCPSCDGKGWNTVAVREIIANVDI